MFAKLGRPIAFIAEVVTPGQHPQREAVENVFLGETDGAEHLMCNRRAVGGGFGGANLGGRRFKEHRVVESARLCDGIGSRTGDRERSFSADPEEQLRQTFVNVGQTLEEAGASWADVVEITSFHVGLRAQAGLLLRVAAEFLSDPYPAWSAVGVSELFEEEALVEIRCVAVTREETATR